MSTRSSARNLFQPLDNPELTIRRRSRIDPTLLNDSKMAAEGNGDLPVPDLRTMEELCQPSLNGQVSPIAPIAIQAMNIGLKNDMIQQVQNSFQFYGLPGDDANKHLDKFLHVTQSIKVNEDTDDALSQRSESSSSITSSFDTKIVALKAEMAEINKNLIRVLQVNQQVKAVTPNCKTYGGPHSFSDCLATVGNTQNVYATRAYQERDTEATKDTMHPTNNGSTKDVQPSVVSTESPIFNFEPVVTPIIEPVTSLVSAPKPNQRPSIPYPSRLHDQKTPLNEHYSSVLLKKFPKKLGDTGKFLIPCDFPGMAECLPLADLDASINLMPLSVWIKLSLPDLSPTCMTLELADHSISCLVRFAEDVFVKVGTFHFLADFVVVDFDADPRVPLILERSFIKTERALIDVFEGELTLREYSQEVISFFDMIAIGNPTPYYDLIVFTTSPTLTLFRNIDFLLEEVDVFLALKDDPTSPEVDQSYVDTGGENHLLEAFHNDDLSLPSPNQGNYLPQVRKELKICEAKIDKSSIDEPPEVELKDLTLHLEYAFLEGDDKLSVIIAKYLSVEEKTALITVLKSHKRAIAWKPSDIKGIDPEFCTHKILIEEDFKPAVQHQRRVNPKIHDVIKNEVLKLLDVGFIYPISNSHWVSLVHCVSKKGGFTVVENEENELILTRLVTGWRVCIDYRKLNEATRKDHFPLPFMDQMLERLAGNEYYCFLNGFSRYFQIPNNLKDQEKLHSLVHTERLPTAACLLGYAMHQAHFRVFGNSFQTCLSHLKRMLKRCEDTKLCLNWEKSHFMVKEGIVLGYNISKNGIKVDKAKVDVIAKLHHPTIIKGIRSFLGHAGFYRRFIQDFSKIARLMTHLLEKDTPFFFSKKCVEAFQTLNRKLTEAPILIALDWDMPFELMCDARDIAIGAVLAQRQEKHFRLIHYASKTVTEAESNYIITEKEMLAVVYSFEQFRSYLIMNKSIVYTDHSALKYLFAKKDSKARLLRWVLLLQEFTFKVIDTKGAENLAIDHLSRLENPHQNVLDPKEINESFPLETLNLVSSRGNSSASWFANFVNYHAGNFVVKGMSSQ
nr:reverse transcriptase domain-containing protein [Tanacetum cinerariifolium]